MHHRIWDAVLSPARSVEVRAWLTKEANRQEALNLRGPQGETMLHWAALSDLGLMLDLIGLGLDPNAVDESGRAALDWQFERLWATHEEGVGNLTHFNRQKIRLLTDDLAAVLWRQGGRPQNNMLDIRALAVCHGLWKVLATWVDLEGPEQALRNWENPAGERADALHHWPLAPADQGREELLDLWKAQGWSVDETNSEGETPLWIAVKQRLEATGNRALGLDLAIDELIEAGASVDHVGPNGLTVSLLPLTSGADLVVVDLLTEKLHLNQTNEET